MLTFTDVEEAATSIYISPCHRIGVGMQLLHFSHFFLWESFLFPEDIFIARGLLKYFKMAVLSERSPLFLAAVLAFGGGIPLDISFLMLFYGGAFRNSFHRLSEDDV